MNKFVIGGILSIFLLTSGCGTDYEQVYTNAKNYFDNGYYDTAKKKYELIIEKSANDDLKKRAKLELDNYDKKVAEHKKHVEEIREQKRLEELKKAEEERLAALKRAEEERKAKERKEAVHNEMLESYNSVLSDTLTTIYGGCSINSNLDYVIVYVKPSWYSINEGYKKAFVKKSMQIYVGMLGARQINVNTENISFYVKDSNTNETLASWDYIRGIKLR